MSVITDNVQTTDRLVYRQFQVVNATSIHGWTQGTEHRSWMGYRVICDKLPKMQKPQLFYKNFICFYIKLLHISTTENDN